MAFVDLSPSGSTASASLQSRYPREWPRGAVPFRNAAEVDTTSLDTATDFVGLYKFPSNAWLDLKSVTVIADDLDTGGTPALVMNFGIVDSTADTSLDTTLIATTNIGQTGGTDEVDAGAITTNGTFLDVGGKWFTMDVATVADTAADGTIQVDGVFYTDLDATTVDGT